jgi:hypothetical protein
MRDAQDDHQLLSFVNLVYDAIVSDADAPFVFDIAKLDTALWTRRIFQGQQSLVYSTPGFIIELTSFALGRRTQ